MISDKKFFAGGRGFGLKIDKRVSDFNGMRSFLYKKSVNSFKLAPPPHNTIFSMAPSDAKKFVRKVSLVKTDIFFDLLCKVGQNRIHRRNNINALAAFFGDKSLPDLQLFRFS